METTQKSHTLVWVIAIIVVILITIGGVFMYVRTQNSQGALNIENSQNTLNYDTNETPQIKPPTSQIPGQYSPTTRKYTHPTGIYSFTYPTQWKVGERLTSISFSEGGVGKGSQFHDMTLSFVPLVEANEQGQKFEQYARYLNHTSEKKEVVLGGIKGMQFYYKETNAAVSTFVILLAYGDKTIAFVAIVTSKDGSTDWFSQSENALHSIIFDHHTRFLMA